MSVGVRPDLLGTRGRRERGGARGTCPTPKFSHWKFLSLNSTEFVTFNRMFSMFFGFLGTLPPRPHPGLPAGDGTPFCPIRNKFLTTPLLSLAFVSVVSSFMCIIFVGHVCYRLIWRHTSAFQNTYQSQTERPTNIQTDKQTDRQRDTQTDWQTHRRKNIIASNKVVGDN